MPNILVFNDVSGALENYVRALNDPMPYNVGGTLTVREFMAGFNYQVLWTDVTTMRAFNDLRAAFGAPITVARAYLRAQDSGGERHTHFCGNGYLLRPKTGTTAQLLAAAQTVELFTDVLEEAGSVYCETRYSSCDFTGQKAGLPNLIFGDRNNFVATAQSMLNTVLGSALVLDGIYGANTNAALRRYQDKIVVANDGIVTLRVWESLINASTGMATY